MILRCNINIALQNKMGAMRNQRWLIGSGILTFLRVEDEYRHHSQTRRIQMAHTAAKRGFFRGAFDALIEARQKQVKSYVNGALLMLDDETLRAHGYNRDELKRARNVSSMF